MIADWRKLFGQGDFPFYIVGLPAFKPRSAAPVNGDEWTETRESQAIAAAEIPNSCLAEMIDTGDADNIHSQEKQPVGERLALCALAKQYGKKIAYAGPTFASAERLPGAMRIHFTHTDGGLVVKGEKLEEFSHGRRRPQVALGRCPHRGRHGGALLARGTESAGGALCMAIESGGDFV